MNRDALLQKAESYARERHLRRGLCLGFGIHGTVFVAERNDKTNVALKSHLEEAAYARERDVYFRLGDLGISRISGFALPELLA